MRAQVALYAILISLSPMTKRGRPLVKPKKGSGLRGYLIVGDQDRWGFDDTKRLASVLKAEGFECELEICPGLGHQFPEDFGQKLEKALTFVAQS